MVIACTQGMAVPHADRLLVAHALYIVALLDQLLVTSPAGGGGDVPKLWPLACGKQQ